MKRVITKILEKNKDVLDSVSDNEITDFENDNGIYLPKDYAELLKTFDGGEILIPGPIIFGVKENNLRKTIKEINGKSFRKNFSIPSNYLIFGKLNYGDFVCINLNNPHDIIQWNHETDQLFCSWESLKDWLKDNLSSFEEFEEENK